MNSPATVKPTSVAQQCERLNVTYGLSFINGEWVDAGDHGLHQIHPSTNETIYSFAEAGASGVDLAVAAARTAFDDGHWRKMAAKQRKVYLQRIIEAIRANKEELSYLQTLDNGIPINFSLNTRVSAETTADIFDHYAGWIDKINGETFPQYTDQANLHYLTFREPVGVVGAIIPWNAPLMMFGLKVAPALATGCTMVLKPSELANIAVIRLAEIIAECDLPPGVFNLVTGAAETGAALVDHPGIDKVTFTGSPMVGEYILAKAGRNMKRVTLELGGKSAALVFPDCKSVEGAANAIMGQSSTFLSGQVCSTTSRAVVHKSIVDEFVEYAQKQVGTIKRGDPFDFETTAAPIISKKQVDRIQEYIEIGAKEGATQVFGGDIPGGELSEGNWIDPTLFSNVGADMTIAQSEIFGPVLSVLTFETQEEAIQIANNSDYGLAGGIYTKDLATAFNVAKEMRTGAVGINGYSVMPNSPAGGLKRSGIGREGGWSTIEAFTEQKTVILNLDQ